MPHILDHFSPFFALYFVIKCFLFCPLFFCFDPLNITCHFVFDSQNLIFNSHKNIARLWNCPQRSTKVTKCQQDQWDQQRSKVSKVSPKPAKPAQGHPMVIQRSSKCHPKVIPKSSQSHPKIIPKSSQSHPKIIPKSSQSHSKVTPRSS